MISYCVDICCVLAGGRGKRTGSDLSAEVAPRQGYSEHGILCLFVYVSLQSDGGNAGKHVCSLSSTALIKGNEASAAYPPVCFLESLKAEVFALQPTFLTGTSTFLLMSVSVSQFLPFCTLSSLIRCFITELFKWQILD